MTAWNALTVWQQEVVLCLGLVALTMLVGAIAALFFGGTREPEHRNGYGDPGVRPHRPMW